MNRLGVHVAPIGRRPARPVHPWWGARGAATLGALALLLCAGAAAVPPATTPAGAAGAAERTNTSQDASSGCTRSAAARPELTEQTETITVAGATRTFLLFTPPPSARPVPLVLDFHGLGEGDTTHALTTQFGPLGQRDGFAVAFPEGSGTTVQWDWTATARPNLDLSYVSALLGSVESAYCIDPTRVYADGFSDGAFMVSLLACRMSKTFAAVATVSGLLVPNPCHPARRIPIVAFHGTDDPILYFNGGYGSGVLNHIFAGGPAVTTTTVPARLHGTGYPAHVQAWAVMDGCNPRPTDRRVGSQVILRTYRCPPGVGVAFYIILGGGHAWPGSAFSAKIAKITGFTTFQINATDAIWQFFRRYHS